MLRLEIDGIRTYDGVYDFDVENNEFTTREWGWIKRFAGYLPGTADEGWAGADPELFAVFGVIALARARRIDKADAADVFDRIIDAPAGAIRLKGHLAAVEDEPAPLAESLSGNSDDSGDASNGNSAKSDATPPAAGTPDLATSASRPPTWAS